MAMIKETFYNIQCDVCGEYADEECWHTDENTAKCYSNMNGFYELGGKFYCSNCWHYNDDNDIETKDGRKFNGETLEEM